ncbi:MAG: DEAD/DEAH box helicase family protein [Nanoarchaeota archaeon]
MSWSLYNQNNFLKPLKFSNGKTQEDVVNEVKELIDKGNKIIFIHGICGTGKSALALHLAKDIGKASVVVPIKNLQEQYKRDYEKDKYVLKENNEKLKISVITGRNNHKCKFLEDKDSFIPKIKREINSKIHDIFEESKKDIKKDLSAENSDIPCKIEIKEKNWNKIKQYLKQNKRINSRDFNNIKDVKRASIAWVCPYWSPALPEKYELKSNEITKKQFKTLNGNFVYHKRKPGCSFYEQFDSYSDSDVIVFNSLKYKIETEIGRKPKTEIEIIDECDEFLDSFANQKNINLNLFETTLIYLISDSKEGDLLIKDLLRIIRQIKSSKKTENMLYKKEIVSLKETGIYDLFKILLKNEEIIYEFDEESYILIY